MMGPETVAAGRAGVVCALVEAETGAATALGVEGQITASGSGARGLDTDSGSLPDGSSLTVHVSSGASIITADDSIRVDGNIASGTVNITNAGDIVSGNYNTSTGAITGTLRIGNDSSGET